MRQQFIFCILCYSFSVFCVINNMFFNLPQESYSCQKIGWYKCYNFTFGKIFQISCHDIICMNRFRRRTLHCKFKNQTQFTKYLFNLIWCQLFSHHIHHVWSGLQNTYLIVRIHKNQIVKPQSISAKISASAILIFGNSFNVITVSAL